MTKLSIVDKMPNTPILIHTGVFNLCSFLRPMATLLLQQADKLLQSLDAAATPKLLMLRRRHCYGVAASEIVDTNLRK